MSDYDDWSGEIGGSYPDTSHAAHKPLRQQEKCSSSKESRASMMVALRESVGLKPAEPKRIDTTSVESELESMKTIGRVNNEND